MSGLPPNPRADSLPDRQHAFDAHLSTDRYGNPLAPRHHLVLLLTLDAELDEEAARTVERAMRTLEAAYDWSSSGLLHVLAWGTDYFERLGRLGSVPLSHPQVLSRTDEPDLLSFDAALVLSTDVPSHLSAVRGAMFGDRDHLNGEPVSDRLGDAFSVAGTRSGFMGEGLPAEHASAEGIPSPDAIPEDAPMFTGFFSGRRKTQASEDRVTVADGPFAGGTTMHLSHLQLSLDRWWTGLDDADRVARMFSPSFSPEDVDSFTTEVPSPDDVVAQARQHDVVGHHEKVKQVRQDGEPIVLRRDFDTVDGGRAGLHFLSLQRRLAHFRKTRKAMNGWYLRDDSPAITDRRNNGILEFVTVVSRANFYVPPRYDRAFPLWSG